MGTEMIAVKKTSASWYLVDCVHAEGCFGEAVQWPGRSLMLVHAAAVAAEGHVAVMVM